MEDLLKKAKQYYGSEENYALLEKAFMMAKKAHEGQVRLSGEPYFAHPYEVANILMDLGLDLITVASGLLHDVMEDTSISSEELGREFGSEVYTWWMA